MWSRLGARRTSARDLRGSHDDGVTRGQKNARRKGPYRHRRYGVKQIEELTQIAAVLDEHGELEDLVAEDLRRAAVGGSTQPMTSRQVLGAFIVKDMNEYDWMTLEWQLVNSQSYRRFCGTEDMFPEYFRMPTLQAHLGALSSETVARLHEVLTEARAALR